jgi:glycosyltransferase involved in cell wall biosynthesis
MEQNKNSDIKDFDTTEINQEMKISDGTEIQTINYELIHLIIARILIFIILVLIVSVIIFIYKSNNNNQIAPDIGNKPEPQKNIINPYFRMMGLNYNNLLDFKPFEMQHYKPDKMELKYYKKYLPRNKNDEIITELNDIFNTKYLLINNSEISFDYIYTIREKDFTPGVYKNKSYENLTFFQEYQNQDLKEIKDFYLSCEKDKPKTKLKKIKSSPEPNVSIIIVFYNQRQKLMRTIKSVQKQSLRRIEIIIVNDNNTNLEEYKSIIEQDDRIRIFTQKEPYGLWRKRMDGFLYSKGKYILHMDAGHVLSDRLVIKDVCQMCVKYDLDSLRFTYSRTIDDYNFKQNLKLAEKKIYPDNDTKIQYGKPKYDVHQFDYRIIWTRLVKAELFSKGLDLVDSTVLNAKKNLWDDMWWNSLINKVSFSNLVINRLGYIYLENKNIEIQPCLDDEIGRDKTMNELLYFLYFDAVLLDKNDEKKPVINNLRKFNITNSTFDGIPMDIEFLRKKSDIFYALMKKMLLDPAVMFADKIYIKELLDSTRQMIKTKKEEKRAKKRAERLALIKAKEEGDFRQSNNIYNNYNNQSQNNNNNQINNPQYNPNIHSGNNNLLNQQNQINQKYNNNIINQNNQMNNNQLYTNNQISPNNEKNNKNNNQIINQINNNNQNNPGINQMNNNQ